jgi:hypothetical protein
MGGKAGEVFPGFGSFKDAPDPGDRWKRSGRSLPGGRCLKRCLGLDATGGGGAVDNFHQRTCLSYQPNSVDEGLASLGKQRETNPPNRDYSLRRRMPPIPSSR